MCRLLTKSIEIMKMLYHILLLNLGIYLSFYIFCVLLDIDKLTSLTKPMLPLFMLTIANF